MNDATTTTGEIIHPFQAAGLGLAPFRYIGMEAQAMTSAGTRIIGQKGGVQLETTTGGTCDYCGHGIMDLYRVRSADGKEFTVGCDCIKKVSLSKEEMRKFDNDRKKLARQKTFAKKVADNARTDARVQAAIDRLDDARAVLAATPHPTAWGVREGKTMVDYVAWMMENAGRTGRLNAAKIIEKSLEK